MTGRRVASVLAGLAALAALVTAALGVVLAWRYWPHGLTTDPLLLSRPADSARRWTTWHDAATLALALSSAAVLLAVICLVVARVRTSVSRAVTIGIAAAALLAALVTSGTRSLVQWDQLGLWSVSVGTDLSGYWPAAFRDDVRFVLADGVEVSQQRYAVVLVVHLLAPVLAAVALAFLARVLVRRPQPTVEDTLDQWGPQQPTGHR